jgi:hypothetical protein
MAAEQPATAGPGRGMTGPGRGMTGPGRGMTGPAPESAA